MVGKAGSDKKLLPAAKEAAAGTPPPRGCLEVTGLPGLLQREEEAPEERPLEREGREGELRA